MDNCGEVYWVRLRLLRQAAGKCFLFLVVILFGASGRDQYCTVLAAEAGVLSRGSASVSEEPVVALPFLHGQHAVFPESDSIQSCQQTRLCGAWRMPTGLAGSARGRTWA
jgi:hypothetical protein